MKRILLSFLILVAVSSAKAQTEPVPADPNAQLTRSSVTDELNKESSSFIGDPDPLDPLPLKKENLKEDEEPILEDIRSVIDAPLPKKNVTKPAKKVTSKKTAIDGQTTSNQKTTSKKIGKRSSKRQNSRATQKYENLNADDPDSQIENRFYQLYKRINSTPTSAEAWSAVAEGRKSEIYVVQKGDNLFTVSKTLFGDPNFWPKIWALNRQGITNPHQIRPGLEIYFYPGSADDLPSLSVGGEAERVFEESSESNSRTTVTRLSNSSIPTAIPDSLPIYRNERYFAKPAAVQVEFEQQPVIQQTFLNDIILSDRKVISEVTIPIEALSKQRCQENLLIKKVKFRRQPAGNYSILESVFPVKAKGVMIYPYRIIGEATATAEGGVKVLSCSRGLTTEVVLVQTSLLPKVRTNKLSMQTAATLIGGPDVNDQVLYTFQQYAYVDLGVQSVEQGQVLDIKSQVTDAIHGQLTIVEKFGGYAVGVITAISDTIADGDTLMASQ